MHMTTPSDGRSEVAPSDTDPLGQSRSPFGVSAERAKFLLLGAAYTGAIVTAHWLAYLIRFEFQPPAEAQTLFWRTLEWALPVELVFLFSFGQFRSLLSYFSFPDANRVVIASAATGLISLGVWYATGGAHAPPRSIIVLSALLDAVGVISVRVLFRKIRERQRGEGSNGAALRRVAIIGAGDVGATLVKELLLRRDLGMLPVAFLDDDQTKWNKQIHGVPVVGRPEVLKEGRIRVEAAIFAMPSAPGKRLREVVQILNKAHIRFETVPSIEQMVTGSVQVSQIRPVEIEDLLGRDEVELDTASIRRFVEGKVVMVTGAGGSIGSELCRQIVALNPQRLLMVEQSEPSLFVCEQEMIDRGIGANATPLVADILDLQRMRALFERHRPQVVFHAAAHKHVYMMERQPAEAIRNNSIGTRMLAEIAIQHQVEAFVLISTDKAINPSNVMGASKRLAEIHLQAIHAHTHQAAEVRHRARAIIHNPAVVGNGGSVPAHTEPSARAETAGTESRGAAAARTKLMAVRFGNVLGSSGSVVPIFKKQIAAGGPVMVTHPEVTRYFMTIPEAVGLVMQAAVLGQGGEIFVLDMGRPVKIVDLARQMIELSGFKPNEDIEIKFSGLKPGEKLFEELQHHGEDHVPTEHPRIMRFVPKTDAVASSARAVDQLEPILYTASSNVLKQQLQAIVPEYTPYLE